MEISEIVKSQRDYFYEGETLDLHFRKEKLIALKNAIFDNLDELKEAFKKDYNKSDFDVLTTEVGLVVNEINYMIRHLKQLAKPKRVGTSLINFPSKGYLLKEPYGVVLIVAPWNYPFQLSIMPLVACIATGNTTVLKPSNYCPTVSAVIKKMLSVFDEKYISVVLGGREQNAQLFDQKFDFIFFTGGTTVAKVLYDKASKNLTPCVLELGGKSPCIVDADCDVDLSAKRIVWGKFLNAGQTCVAPDHIYVHADILEKFVEAVKKYIKQFYYPNGSLTENFPYIINEKHTQRLMGLIDVNKVVAGGGCNGRCIEPTVMTNVTWDDKIMGEEIFGPIMPILTFNDLGALVKEIQQREKPLALYYFGNSKKSIRFVTQNVSYGGGCINDTIMHLTEETLPFGGVGFSGMGNYHGKRSFETFSHEKSVLKKSTIIDMPIRYMPYTSGKAKIANLIFGVKSKKREK